MYNSLNLAKMIKLKASQKNVVIKNMLADLNLGSNTMSNLYHGKSLAFDSLAKIADYLNCSIDELLGRSVPSNDETENINLDNLFVRMKELKISVKKISDDTGISTGNISDWKNGRSLPSSSKLYILADYLDCSTDYLLGRVNTQKNISGGNKNNSSVTVQTVQDNHGVIGHTNMPVNFINSTTKELSKQEIELLNIFNKLDIVKQAKLLVYASNLEKE